MRWTKLIINIFILLLFAIGLAFSADDYPYPNESYNNVDPWQFYYRECTSFVSWRMNRDAGTINNNYSF